MSFLLLSFYSHNMCNGPLVPLVLSSFDVFICSLIIKVYLGVRVHYPALLRPCNKAFELCLAYLRTMDALDCPPAAFKLNWYYFKRSFLVLV